MKTYFVTIVARIEVDGEVEAEIVAESLSRRVCKSERVLSASVVEIVASAFNNVGQKEHV